MTLLSLFHVSNPWRIPERGENEPQWLRNPQSSYCFPDPWLDHLVIPWDIVCTRAMQQGNEVWVWNRGVQARYDKVITRPSGCVYEPGWYCALVQYSGTVPWLSSKIKTPLNSAMALGHTRSVNSGHIWGRCIGSITEAVGAYFSKVWTCACIVGCTWLFKKSPDVSVPRHVLINSKRPEAF